MTAATSASPGSGEIDVDAVAATVTALPEVEALAATGRVPVATYLPGRRVLGVRVDEGSVTVAVVGAPRTPVAAIAAAVRRGLAPLVGARRVDVHVEDLATGEPSGR